MSADTPKEEEDVGMMSDEEVEKQILAKLPGILKLTEDMWREYVVRDYNSLAKLVIQTGSGIQMSMKNFVFIADWMKKMDARVKLIEEKLSFLETAEKKDQEKKHDFYLQ